MSVKLINNLAKSLRSNFPRLLTTKGLQASSIATMDAVTVENKEGDEVIPSKNATRYKNRFRKRQWEDIADKKVENGEVQEKRTCDQPTERIKKKKMAMLLGYCGVDYFGMQRNPGVRTIEEDLLKALLEAKYITEVDFNNQQNAQFQRSSRTDKGVSAARQVVSLKMPLVHSVEEINKRLPECIKVFAIKRVTKGFNSKLKCNARTYSYTLPTYTFDASLVTPQERRAYRISKDKLEQVESILAVYKGTKSYHNFTEKKQLSDPSALRYMMHFQVDKVFVERDIEFAVLSVKGQSFMLHQIRKMVGLAVAILRAHTDISIMDRAFGKDKVMIPTAPGLGLVLDMVHYDKYDTKFKDSHDSLTWETEEEAIQKFKREHIYPNIIKGEVEGDSMGTWLEKLLTHSYEPSEDGAENNEDIADAATHDSNKSEVGALSEIEKLQKSTSDCSDSCVEK